jgi:hypothetical protein
MLRAPLDYRIVVINRYEYWTIENRSAQIATVADQLLIWPSAVMPGCGQTKAESNLKLSSVWQQRRQHRDVCIVTCAS